MATTNPAIPATGTFCLPQATRVVLLAEPPRLTHDPAQAPFAALATIQLLAPEAARELIISGLAGVPTIIERIEQALITRELRLRGR